MKTSCVYKWSLRLGKKWNRWAASHIDSRFPGKIVIGDKVVSDLKPLGNVMTPGMTKAKRLSFKGICEGQAVKVYSTHSPEQMALRLALQGLSFGSCCFPELVASSENLIAEAWVEGDSLRTLSKNELGEAAPEIQSFLNQLHTFPAFLQLAEKHLYSFCYFEDYLLKRLRPWSHIDRIEEFKQRWACSYNEHAASIPVCLSHPDLSADNIIKERGVKKYYIVDNELLGAGKGWILDWHNSYLNKFGIGVDEHVVSDDFIELSWRLRKLGSALDAHDFDMASALLEERKI